MENFGPFGITSLHIFTKKALFCKVVAILSGPTRGDIRGRGSPNLKFWGSVLGFGPSIKIKDHITF